MQFKPKDRCNFSDVLIRVKYIKLLFKFPNPQPPMPNPGPILQPIPPIVNILKYYNFNFLIIFNKKFRYKFFN